VDTLLEQKIAILCQAVLIWVLSFMFHLFFTSVAWGNPTVHSALSILVIVVCAAFLLWLNMSRDRYYSIGILVLTIVLWTLICIVVDFAVHIQTRLADLSMHYMFTRGWHFLLIIPVALLTWVAFKRTHRDQAEVKNIRFIGRRR